MALPSRLILIEQTHRSLGRLECAAIDQLFVKFLSAAPDRHILMPGG
jgi:hypothetical protein